MQDPKIGTSYSFSQLVKAYSADQPGDDDAHFLLHKGDEILALCLRHKFNPKPREIWIGNDPVVAEWGRKLAGLKGKNTVPLYYSQPGRTLYEFKGRFLITGDTEVAAELKTRPGPVPLSRIVFIMPLENPEFSHRN